MPLTVFPRRWAELLALYVNKALRSMQGKSDKERKSRLEEVANKVHVVNIGGGKKRTVLVL